MFRTDNNQSRISTIKPLITIFIAIVIFLLCYFFLPTSFSADARVMTAIVCFGVILWAFEPIPMGMTALVLLVSMLLFNSADMDVVFSGFASPATHLIIGGMLIASAVNETTIVKRVTFLMLKKWGGSAKGLLGSLILIQQIQAFFIPSTAVRTTLVLPISDMIVETIKAKPGSNLRKMLMLGVAFGGNVSGTAILTAAIGNILTVELLNRYGIASITYFDWLLYTFPLWLLLIPAIWILLLKYYPLKENEKHFPMIKNEMQLRLNELGPMNKKELRCLLILIVIVILWMSEGLHGLHPSVPALIGAILMTFPHIGIAPWNRVVQINFNTILLVAVTLSIGYGLIDSGAVNLIGDVLSVHWVLQLVQIPILGIIIIIILVQLLHKLVSNVSAAVVTLVPMTISVAANAGVDPLAMAFTAGLTSLYGYVLAVETMPNILVHGTGLVSQRDFLMPGIYATIITSILTVIVAATWWRIVGLL